MNLLSKNDYNAISNALRRMEPLTLTRTLGDTELTVRVKEAGKAWPVAMLVQLRIKCGRVEWVQTFDSLKNARAAL